jgi:L-fucose mutarotase
MPRIFDTIRDAIDDAVLEAAWQPPASIDQRHMGQMFEDFTAVLPKHKPKQKIVKLVGDAFDYKVKACFAIAASSEPRLDGNIIIKKGAIYPA